MLTIRYLILNLNMKQYHLQIGNNILNIQISLIKVRDGLQFVKDEFKYKVVGTPVHIECG